MKALQQSETIFYFSINENGEITECSLLFKKVFELTDEHDQDSLLHLSKVFMLLPEKDSIINKLLAQFKSISSKDLFLNLSIDLQYSLEAQIKSTTHEKVKEICFFGEKIFLHNQYEMLLDPDNLKLIDLAGDAIVLGDESGNIISFNQKLLEFTNFKKEELIGQHIRFLFFDNELIDKPLRFDLLENNSELLRERKLKQKQGSGKYIEMLSKKVKSGYISIMRDIEDRKKAESKLEELRKRLLFVTKMEKIGIIDLNLNTNTINYNEEMCQILGVEAQIESCKSLTTWLKHIHPDDEERIKEVIDEVKNTEQIIEFIYRTKPINSEFRTIKASANIFYPKNSDQSQLIVSSLDITNSNILKLQLQEKENTFNALTNSASAAIFIYDQKFLYVNYSFEKITGYPSYEALNMNFWELIHPDHREMVKNRGQQRLSGDIAPTHYDFKIVTKSGEEKWLELAASKISFMGKTAAIGSAFDITKRKKLEIDLKSNIQALELERKKVEIHENQFKNYMLYNTAPMLVIDTTNKNIVFANHAASELYGYNKDELLNLKIYDIQTISKKEIDNKMETTIKSNSKEFLFKHRKKDNSIIDVKINASHINNENNTNMVLIIHDMTQEIANKSKLKETHATYRNIINNISEMIYILNRKGEFLFVNKASINNYGYDLEEIIGKTPAFLSAPNRNNLNKVIENLELAYQGTQNTFEFWGLRKNGSEFPKEVVLSPGFYFGEKVIIAVSRDISEHKKTTMELIAAKEKAEESDKLKSAFLANMSHEIRTPMNAILGFSELVKDPEMETEERLRFLNIINRSSLHLLHLINDLVDISKIYSNQMKVSKNNCQLNSLFFEIYEFFENEMIKSGKNDKVKLSVSFGLAYGEDYILTDETRLRQILTNTIGNAIKFTEKGFVKFSYLLKENEIIFKIEDTGIGINEEQKKIIFERFTQADETISKKYGGTGLGLAISKACIELLGGEIWLESELEKGTSVYFSLPYIKVS